VSIEEQPKRLKTYNLGTHLVKIMVTVDGKSTALSTTTLVDGEDLSRRIFLSQDYVCEFKILWSPKRLLLLRRLRAVGIVCSKPFPLVEQIQHLEPLGFMIKLKM
jgi:hypothetical protein